MLSGAILSSYCLQKTWGVKAQPDFSKTVRWNVNTDVCLGE